MKTAVLVFGMLREYDKVMVNWELDKYLDCDYYFSTWNYSKEKYDNFCGEEVDNYREYIVTEELIKSLFPNAICSILNENDIFTKDAVSYSKMFFHWKNCYKLMIESKKEYDLILLVRPDCEIIIHNRYNKNKNYENEPIKNWDYKDYLLYSNRLMQIRPTGPKESPMNPCEYSYGDLFFCGSRCVMDIFINSIPDMSLDENKYKNWLPEVDLAKLLYPMGLYPSDIHPFYINWPVRACKEL